MTSTSGHADEDPDAVKGRMLETATNSIDIVSSLLQEIELLLARLEPRVKSLTHTGFPTFVRSLRRDQDTLRRIIDDLQGAALTEDELRERERRLEHSRVNVGQAHLKWSVLKRCRSIVAINQSFHGSTKESRREQVSLQEQGLQVAGHGSKIPGHEKQQLHRTLKSKAKVEVDVIDGGFEWVDIRSVGRWRLARQMTDAGWPWGDVDGPDEDVDPEDWESVPLAMQVRRLAEAARLNRHEYAVPRVRVVLPNIGRGDDPDVDVFLAQLTGMDPLVQILIEDRNSAFMRAPTPSLETVLDNLVGDELASLTPTLNMDHTILIDLISDITHAQLEPQPWQASTTQLQIEEERLHEGGLMAKTLYPVLAGRHLVCTREAAEHFHEVLSTVGTALECQRGRLLVPCDDDTRSMSTEDIRAQFVALSIHPPPPDVQIPVTILPTSWGGLSSVSTAVEEGRLPRVALDVARCGNFSNSKLSIYMQGWATGDVTVTSNKEIRGQIRTWVEANRQSDEDAGPRIYRLDVTRNLLAKSKTAPEGWDGTVREDGDD